MPIVYISKILILSSDTNVRYNRKTDRLYLTPLSEPQLTTEARISLNKSNVRTSIAWLCSCFLQDSH